MKFRSWDEAAIDVLLAECGGVRVGQIPQIQVAYVAADPAGAATLEEVRAALRARPEVLRAPFLTLRPVRLRAYHGAGLTDPLIDYNYQAKRTNLYRAHKYTRGDPAIRIAMVDTGLVFLGSGDVGTPDAYGRADSSGIVWGQVADPFMGEGGSSHGTFVWTIGKGRAQDGTGCHGVAPGCYGIAISFGMLYYTAQAVVGAADAGARVINASWGDVRQIGEEDSQVVPGEDDTADAIRYAQSLGCLIVSAAGNNEEFYDAVNHYQPAGFQVPNDLDGVLNVSSAGGPQPVHEYDNPISGPDMWAGAYVGPAYGPGIQVVAPGMDAFGQYGVEPLTWAYDNWEGGIVPAGGPDPTSGHSTSFSAPQVWGACGLVLSVNPNLTAAEVQQIIVRTAVPGAHEDWGARYPSGGMLDIGKAVELALSTLDAPTLASRFPSEAGKTIRPYVGFSGPGAVTTIASGTATTALHGPVRLDVTGFQAGAEVARVRLRLGAATLYDGPPALLRATASTEGSAQQVSVDVLDGGGEVLATEAYSDITVATIADITATLEDVELAGLVGSLALTGLAGEVSTPQASRLLLPGPLSIWDGSALVPAPLRVFDGSTLT